MNTSDMFQAITPIIEQYAIYIAAFAFTIVTALYLSRNKIKQVWSNFKINRQLNNLGVKQLSDVQWPDGMDHYFTIDHLVLRPDCISLIMYIRYTGKIFCAENIEEWTQMIGQKSYTFKNPLNELNYQINTLSESIPNIPVNGYVYFDHHCEFPKGRPDRVIHYNEIPEELKRNKQDIVQENIAAAWEQILQIKN